jgi:beta-lactamase class A
MLISSNIALRFVPYFLLMRIIVAELAAREMGVRRLAVVAAGLAWAVGIFALSGTAVAGSDNDDPLSRKLVEMESRLGARIGAAILDTGTGRQWLYRSDERFPLNSTFKAFACAGLLARVDAGKEDLGRAIVFKQSDLVTYSPITEKRVGGKGMTLFELCHAAMTLSDNTAANLVLDSLGGPEGFTAFAGSIGDTETRLDRRETELNEAKPGDPRDTTTPAAAARSLHDLVLGDILSQSSRQQLKAWLVGNEVGGPLLRASLPQGWQIGDRTGAGGYGSRSIIAVIWPPERKPVIAAIYLTGAQATMDERNATIAEIGNALVRTLSE